MSLKILRTRLTRKNLIISWGGNSVLLSRLLKEGVRMQTKVMTVTPKLAAEWLERNHCNRPISQRMVEEYKWLINEGKFYLTHQGVAFDTQDRLRDGQHRLRAIVETGTSAKMVVATGLGEEALQAIDSGRRRTDQQVLSMAHGEYISSFVTAIAREMFGGGLHLGTGKRQIRPMRLELITFYETHREAIEFAADHFRDRLSGLSVAYIAAAIARAYYHCPQKKLARFAEVLAHGYSREGEGIIIKLRNYILRVRRSGPHSASQRDDIYAKVERAIQAYVKNEEAPTLVGVKTEIFPLPEDEELKQRIAPDEEDREA